MADIILLDNIRQDRRTASNEGITYPEIQERIINTASHHVSVGAVVLLHHIAYLINKGHAHLSFTYLCDRIGIARTTLAAYTEELEDKRMVRIVRARKDTKYNYPNHFAIDFTGPLGDPVNKLKLPKNLNKMGSSKMLPPPAKVVAKVDGNNTNVLLKNKILVPKGTRRSVAPQFETISEAIESSTKRIVRKRQEKAAKVSKPGSHITLAGVKACWATAMLTHYPTVPPVVFSAKEFAIFKMKIAPIVSVVDLPTFFDWIVSQWTVLRQSKFGWLQSKGKDIAASPSLPELMRYFKIFAQAFSDSRLGEVQQEKKLTHTPLDKAQLELQETKAKLAKAEAAQRSMAERLVRAERAAATPVRKEKEKAVSLSERMKRVEHVLDDDTPLPHWNSNGS